MKLLLVLLISSQASAYECHMEQRCVNLNCWQVQVCTENPPVDPLAGWCSEMDRIQGKCQ